MTVFELLFLKNWDLFILGVVIVTTAVLGFIVYFENPKSPTRKFFLGFALSTTIWGVFNYLSYHVVPALFAFYILRLTIFAVMWETYFFLEFALAFPKEDSTKNRLSRTLLIITTVVACLTLTDLIFKGIGSVSSEGIILTIANGPAFPIFGMLSVGFTVFGVGILLWKTLRSGGGFTDKHYYLISTGVFMMFVFIIVSNFILPVFFNNTLFLPYGALFVFPFIALTSYAIVRDRVFNVRIISGELFITILLLLSIIQLVQSRELSELVLRIGILIGLLGVGILLIRSILREVKQREELQKLNKELEEKKIQLEDLSRFKTQLLSLASHQIKSPLAAIKGFVSLILEGAYGETTDTTKETLVRVKQSADELINLVNTLLDLRKVEEGKMDYQFKKTDMVKLTKDIVEGLRPLALEKKLDFSFSSVPNELFVSADEEKLKQVIQNITDNAIKYTPTGFVKVEVRDTGSEAIISVLDSGLGISPILLPHIFEEFVRDEKVKKEIKGTGLGLYIARKIVEAHGGKIWAESEGDGKGSKFFVALRKVV